MLVFRRVLTFATIWMLFEVIISWLGTCHPGDYPQRAQYGYQETCELFIGPLSLFIQWFITLWDANRIIAAFTVVLGISTIFLWLSTQGLERATIKAADAAAKDTRILQRAYVAVEPAGIHLRLEGDGILGHIKVVNAGNLPARNLGWFIDIKFSANAVETSFPLGNPKGNIIIAPRAFSVRGSNDNLDPIEIDAAAGSLFKSRAEERTHYVYVWGLVQYADGFDVIRVTKFCHRYNWKMRGKGDVLEWEISAEYARQHEHGNDAT